MRSALLIRLPFLLLFLCVAAFCQPPGQQINPHTQIRWPRNCTGPGHVYNYENNTCIDMDSINPATQLLWPGGCSTASMVYAPQSNACFDINAINPGTQITWGPNCNAAGMVYNFSLNSCFDVRPNISAGTTTTLPPGSPATVTQIGAFPNYILNFGIPAGIPGGSLSYPGVLSDGSNGLTVTGSTATSSVKQQLPAAAGLSVNYVVCLSNLGSVIVCPTTTQTWVGVNTTAPASGNTTVTTSGIVNCVFDNAVTIGDYVTASTATAGQCHDGGATYPPLGTLVGEVTGTATAGVAPIQLMRAGGALPGVTSDGSNGIAVQGAVTATSLPGYRQNTVVARSRDRDEVLSITITPQDMPGCQQSGLGNIDDAVCFNAAINYLSTQDQRATKRLIVPYTYAGYSFRNPGYQQPLPRDFGDYHGFAGYATAASVTLTIASGTIQSCAVAAGTGYAPSANLPVAVYDPSLKGSGGYATVQTNAAGTPTGCTVPTGGGGINYPGSGVYAQVVAVGGHGATGTCSLQGGAIVAGSCTVTNGGSGYGTVGGYSVPVGIAGALAPVVGGVATPNFTCTGPYPTMTSTTSATTAAVTGVTQNTNGSGCTYQGCDGTSTAGACVSPMTVPLVFGGSCNGAQCTILPPETAYNLPCGVALINNLIIEGVGNPTINGPWNGTAADLNQMTLFCEPTGQQSSRITIRGINFNNAFFAFYFPYVVQEFKMEKVVFQTNVAFPFYTYSFGAFNVSTPPGNNGATNNYAPLIQSRFTDIDDYGYSGITCGGAWIGRTTAPYQASSTYQVTAGGYQNLFQGIALGQMTSGFNYQGSHSIEIPSFDPCVHVKVDNFMFDSAIGHSAASDNFDKFFEQYIWKTQNGPATPYTSPTSFMSNGLATSMNTAAPGPGCKFTQTVVDRSVDFGTGIGTLSPSNVGSPYSQCFPGINQSLAVFYPRYASYGNSNTGVDVSFTDIYATSFNTRPILTGRFDVLNVNRLQGKNRTTGYGTDPYLQTGEIRGAINLTSRYTYASSIQDVSATLGYGNLSTGPTIQYLLNGIAQLPGSQFQYARGVANMADSFNIYSALSPAGTVPSGSPTNSSLNLVDTTAAVGAGGSIYFSGPPGPNGNGLVAMKSYYQSATYYPIGDLIFYTRPSGCSTCGTLTEALRLKSGGNWQLTKPDVAAGTLATYTTGTACGTISGQVGGAAAGKFTSTGTACTVVIAPGFSAPNGYRCSGSDIGPGSPGAVMNQTATTATTCTLVGTITSGDSVVWSVIAF